MKIEEALNKLFSLHQFGVKLGLENITKLLEYLGNPQNEFPSIHIAGSNGKGSTASFLSSVLMESGFKTGLFTSPHLVKFNERIRINGKEISDERILRFVEKTNDYVQLYKPTFFELTTALAFEYFAENKVDVAVIETGLGGRLDATNVIKPRASVITTISLEHVNVLGDTIEKIAEEKAGIIKPATPVFTGLLEVDALKVIENKCWQVHSELIMLKDYLEYGKDFTRLKIKDFRFTIYSLGLRGSHQLVNSALALLVANKIFGIQDYDSVNNGLLNVVKNSGIRGRYEVVSSSPKIIFDAAHNLECVQAFIKEFRKEKCPSNKAFLIFGAMKDKNIKAMLNILRKYFDNIFATTIDYSRAASVTELIEAAKEIKLSIKPLPFNEIKSFVQKFIKNNEECCIVMLGSIYIIGEIRSKLKI